MAQAHGRDAAGNEALTKVAVALAAAALVVMVVMAAAGVEGPIWIVQGALAAAAAVVAWRAGGTTPRKPWRSVRSSSAQSSA